MESGSISASSSAGHRQRARRFGDDALVLVQVQHGRAHRALVDGGDRNHVTRGRKCGIGQCACPIHRGAVDELVDVVERDRFARRQRGDHRGGAGRLDTQHRCARGPLGQVGGDARDAAAAADRNDHQVRLALELLEQLGGNGALPGHRARIVVRRHQGCAGARDILERGRRGVVVRGADGDELDVLAAVIADAVAFLLRRLDRHVDPAADPHRPARQRETLGVIARRRAHHTGGDLGLGQLHQQVVGAAQLVGPHGLQVFTLEENPGAGRCRQPFGELQRTACHHAGNSLNGPVDVGRGQRRRRARGLAQFSGHRSMVPSGGFPAKISFAHQR